MRTARLDERRASSLGRYTDFFIDFYAVFFTPLPIVVVASNDQDVPKALSAQSPQLYSATIRRIYLTHTGFARWMLEGIWLAAIAAYLPGLCFGAINLSGESITGAGDLGDPSIGEFKFTGMIILVCGVNLRLALEVHSWGRLELTAFGITLVILWLTCILFSEAEGARLPPQLYWGPVHGVLPYLYGEGKFWFCVILAMMLTILPRWVARSFHTVDSSSPVKQILMRGTKGKITKHNSIARKKEAKHLREAAMCMPSSKLPKLPEGSDSLKRQGLFQPGALAPIPGTPREFGSDDALDDGAPPTMLGNDKKTSKGSRVGFSCGPDGPARKGSAMGSSFGSLENTGVRTSAPSLLLPPSRPTRPRLPRPARTLPVGQPQGGHTPSFGTGRQARAAPRDARLTRSTRLPQRRAASPTPPSSPGRRCRTRRASSARCRAGRGGRRQSAEASRSTCTSGRASTSSTRWGWAVRRTPRRRTTSSRPRSRASKRAPKRSLPATTCARRLWARRHARARRLSLLARACSKSVAKPVPAAWARCTRRKSDVHRLGDACSCDVRPVRSIGRVDEDAQRTPAWRLALGRYTHIQC